MGRNLTNLYISQSFEYLVQLSGSELQTGLGSTLTGSLLITASKADTATSASFASTATSASFASTAISSSYAVTASYAMNAGTTVSTASLLTTASANVNIITFTKGDGSTFPVTVATGSAVSASFATTASLALNNVLTSSTTNATITFTKGDGTTYTNVINNVTNATSASVAVSASYALSSSYAVSASQAQNAVSASYAPSVSPFPFTGSAIISGSLRVTGSSNFTGGDFKVTDQARNAEFDVDAFKVKTQTGTQFTGSVSSQNGFTGSLAGTASYANNALSSSYAVSASQAQNAVSSSFATTASFASTTNTSSLLTTASAAGNVVTFTKGDGSTFPVTVATGSAASTFPYTGSAIISGSLQVTGSFGVTGSVTGNVIGNNTDTYTSSAAVQQIVTLTQAEYNAIGSPNANTLYVISGSSTEFALLSGSNTFVGNQVISGSVRQNVVSSSIASQTASINLSSGNYFDLTLSSGSNTLINLSNILPGQTVNLRINQPDFSYGSVTLPSTVKQPLGTNYVATTGSLASDVLTLVSFNTSSIYLSNTSNFLYYDPNAQLFIDTTGISGSNAAAVNQLVLDLKSYNLWTKLYAFYPFIGGTAYTNKFNLVNPADTDAAYRITYRNQSNLTFSSNGVQNVGGVLDSGMVTNFNLISASVGFSFSAGIYGAVNNPGGIDVGVWTGVGSNSGFYLGGNCVGANIALTDCFSEADGRIVVGGQTTGGSGFTQVSSTSNTSLKIYRNGSSIGSLTSPRINTPPSWPVSIGGVFYQSLNAMYDISTNSYRSVYFSSGLSDTEVANMYTCVQTYNTTLGRNA